MRDDDFVSIVVFEQGENSPIDLKQTSPVHFVRVSDLRAAFAAGQVSITKPKGVEEGSEIRVVWTCAIAKQQSEVFAVEQGKKISLTPIPEACRQTIQLSRNKGKITLLPQVAIGEIVDACQIVASVVPIQTTLQCPPAVDEHYFIEKLASVNLSERYAAAKALRYRGYNEAKQVLEARMNDNDEDIYVQLEAAAALAAYDDPNGWGFIENKLRSPVMAVPLETQLETVIVASEIPKLRSENLLIEVLQSPDRDDELRAGAAWALGQFASASSATALVNTFNLSTLEIKVEAARALLRFADPQINHLVNLLRNSEPTKRDGISWALARAGKFNPSDIIVGADENLRKWSSYIMGYGKDNFVKADVEAICKADPEVYFAASVLWQIISSWIHDLKEY
jgi:HEAT repeat protein